MALLGDTLAMPRPSKSILVPALCAGTILGFSGGLARAAEPAPTPPPANWWERLIPQAPGVPDIE